MKTYTILIPWISDNVTIAVKFTEIEGQPDFYLVEIGGKLKGRFHRDLCGLRLAEELVKSL